MILKPAQMCHIAQGAFCIFEVPNQVVIHATPILTPVTARHARFQHKNAHQCFHLI